MVCHMSAPPLLNLELRFNNHNSRLHAHSKMSAANKDKDDTIYRHFHSDGYHRLQDVKIHLIDTVMQKKISLQRKDSGHIDSGQ